MEDSVITLGSIVLVFPAVAKQLLLSLVYGMAIGVERAWNHKKASLRTFSLMCAGSCLFSLISVMAVTGAHEDTTRIAAAIITGIGFMGGGVIFKTSNRVEGITTGAMIFLTSAIGMACGFNLIALASWGFITYMLIHIVGYVLYHTIQKYRPEESGT